MNGILDILGADAHHKSVVLDAFDEDTQTESALRKGQRSDNLSVVLDFFDAFECLFVEEVDSLAVFEAPLVREELVVFEPDFVVEGFIDNQYILLKFFNIIFFEIVGDFFDFVFGLLTQLSELFLLRFPVFLIYFV